MSKILKEFAEKKYPEDNSDPAPEEINQAPHAREFAQPTHPEPEQLAELQEVERRFQTVFEAAPIGIAVANPAGYFVEVNDALAESEKKYRMLFENGSPDSASPENGGDRNPRRLKWIAGRSSRCC